jgi:xanthine dehydrogenase accessory factor
VDNVDVQVLKKADEWVRTGHRAVMGTIVRTWGSAPRPVGSLVVIRDDGLVAGSVSGGCIEDDLVDRVRAGALATKGPQRVIYGVTAEDAFKFGLPCGGTLELVLEPVTPQTQVSELLARIIAGEQTLRTLDMKSGRVTLGEGTGTDVLSVSDDRLVTVHGPRWRLLIIGAGQLTHFVAQMALALDYQVTICDPREEYADGWLVPGTTLVRTMPDDTVIEFRPDRNTAIIALTHDPKLDDLALMEALKSSAFYIGAIGSKKNQAARRERLLEFGVTPEQLELLHGPIGLKNGARTPSEIAVSILAELTGVKYGYHIPAPIPVAATATVEAGCVV